MSLYSSEIAAIAMYEVALNQHRARLSGSRGCRACHDAARRIVERALRAEAAALQAERIADALREVNA